MINIIAAVTRDGGLGRDGDLLHHISADLRRFKELTMGHPIIMGRKTFESFQKGPLPGRRNIVISRNRQYTHPGIEVFPSLTEALQTLHDTDCFIIGGGSVYQQALDMAQRIYLTEIDTDSPAGTDTFFPMPDPATWSPVETSPLHTDPKSGVTFKFVTYLKNTRNI